MRYLLVLEQDGGCDYTIGCGMRVETVLASNMAEAVEKGWEYLGDCDGIDRATLYEVADAYSFDLPAYRAKRAAEKEALAKVAHEKAECAEYERLKRKFEAGG